MCLQMDDAAIHVKNFPLHKLEIDFVQHEMIGSGKFGKVYRVVCRTSGKLRF